jgi:outer membrane protein TolC
MAEAALTASRRAAEAARLAITRDFPTLDVALPPSVPEPQEPAGDEASWAERIMAHDHGLELAETTAAASRLALQRARRERLPDPTLGLQYSDNFDTNREVVGLRLIVPLGVSGRSADIAAARSRAAMADANRDRARRAGEHDAHAAFLDAQAAIAQWRQAASAALTAERTAQALFEGYRLGEYDFAAVLTARRQAADATGQSDLARIAAWEANALLQIDAHLMWAAPEASEHGLAPLSPP